MIEMLVFATVSAFDCFVDRRLVTVPKSMKTYRSGREKLVIKSKNGRFKCQTLQSLKKLH